MIDKNCENCRWAYKDELGDYFCTNADSDRCTDWVTDQDCCKLWENNMYDLFVGNKILNSLSELSSCLTCNKDSADCPYKNIQQSIKYACKYWRVCK